MNCLADIKDKDFWLYSAVFFMCRAMGVLPLVRNTHINPLQTSESNKGSFGVSRWGQLFNVFHFLLLVVCGYRKHIDWNNLLTLHSLFWIQNIFSALISVLLPLCQISSLLDQISNAWNIYCLYSRKAKSFSFFLLFLLFQPFIPMFYQLLWLPFLSSDVNFYFLDVNYVTQHTTAVQVVISSLCFIAINAYVDINQQLNSYNNSKFDSKSIILVKKHLDNYILVSKFVRRFSTHFSATFLNSFLSLISRTVVFVVFSVSNIKNGTYHEIFVFAFTNFYVVFSTFFVCYCGQKVKEEQIKTSIIVRRIRVLWIDKITEDEAFLLDTYEELMEVTAAEFSACGLFPVNLEQCLHVLGIIVSYGLVAAQA